PSPLACQPLARASHRSKSPSTPAPLPLTRATAPETSIDPLRSSYVERNSHESALRCFVTAFRGLSAELRRKHGKCAAGGFMTFDDMTPNVILIVARNATIGARTAVASLDSERTCINSAKADLYR